MYRFNIENCMKVHKILDGKVILYFPSLKFISLLIEAKWRLRRVYQNRLYILECLCYKSPGWTRCQPTALPTINDPTYASLRWVPIDLRGVPASGDIFANLLYKSKRRRLRLTHLFSHIFLIYVSHVARFEERVRF